MSHFFELAQVLARWPEQPPQIGPFPIGCEERLRRALEQKLVGDAAAPVGRGDLAGLVRDVLVALRLRSAAHALTVPTTADWPDADLWKAHGVRVTIATADQLHLETGDAEDWRPRWLTGNDRATPLRDAFEQSPRRSPPSDPEALVIDPCLRDALKLPFETYQSQGQQQAIRSAFNVEPATTVLILLPTGAGKSLAAWAPALLGSHSARVSLVVTPTIALAIDQEKQVQQLTGRREPMAYHSALADETRARIKQGIRAGSQRIIFASPESIMGSLSHAIYDAAARGYLANFIIDEAHLVAEWGDEFRPEFQAVAGVRRDLLSRTPREKQFRTLLMTATLTTEGYHTLRALFGTPGTMEVISAVHLRAEPSYWIYHAADRAEQEQRVLEAMRHAPRPFLLYTTRPKDAEFWRDELRRHGVHRIGLVHGGTDDRESVIEQWRDGAIDGVVATSAFGLGMDKRDVRTVIHACVPETVDRFYQEVGRGGRDGNACASILIYTEKDLEDARRLNQKRIISVDRGLERWVVMAVRMKEVAGSNTAQGPLYQLDLSSRPTGVSQDSPENQAWNLRTIMLMARAGLLMIDSGPPPRLPQEPEESDVEFEARIHEALDRYYRSAFVRVLDQRHLDEQFWVNHMERFRRLTREADRRNLELMRQFLDGEVEMSAALRELYTIQTPDGEVEVVPACGGCPRCRADGMDRRHYHPPTAWAAKQTAQWSSPRLLAMLGGDSVVVLTYPPPGPSPAEQLDWQQRLLHDYLPVLVRHGIREIAADATWLTRRDFRSLYRHARDWFLIHTDTDAERTVHGPEALQVPRLTLCSPSAGAPVSASLWLIHRPIHLLLIPADTRDADHPHRRFTDTARHTRIEDFIARLSK